MRTQLSQWRCHWYVTQLDMVTRETKLHDNSRREKNDFLRRGKSLTELVSSNRKNYFEKRNEHTGLSVKRPQAEAQLTENAC